MHLELKKRQEEDDVEGGEKQGGDWRTRGCVLSRLITLDKEGSEKRRVKGTVTYRCTETGQGR